MRRATGSPSSAASTRSACPTHTSTAPTSTLLMLLMPACSSLEPTKTGSNVGPRGSSCSMTHSSRYRDSHWHESVVTSTAQPSCTGRQGPTGGEHCLPETPSPLFRTGAGSASCGATPTSSPSMSTPCSTSPPESSDSRSTACTAVGGAASSLRTELARSAVRQPARSHGCAVSDRATQLPTPAEGRLLVHVLDAGSQPVEQERLRAGEAD